MTPWRVSQLRMRLREYGEDFWGRVESECGQLGQWARDRGFVTLDFVLDNRNCQKLLEGNYREKKSRRRSDWYDPDKFAEVC